ncbi:MAG TPA: ABC transporter substrate-binding protein, partial [Acetobacteraceae bacterium]|nr:ABC transporter substrate-binding protein [Acetobacteraceae bacterium]
MKRRDLLKAGAVAALSPGLWRPAIAAPAGMIKFVPQTSLTSLDPVWTTAAVTRGFAYLVYETLFAYDEHLEPRPLMVEAMATEDGGRRVTLRLRADMPFHDGTPVLARDCAASLRRWMVRDPVGQTISDRLEALETPDDRTLVFRLRKPFPLLPRALAKTQPSPVIMPERLAKTDPYKQVTEVVGSGAFRFLPDEFVSGAAAGFAKFDRYVARDDPTSFAAGAHRVLVDRVEWHVLPDPATVANALLAGEVDWVEMPLPDQLPQLRRSRALSVGPIDLNGILLALRPNHLHPPTNNPLFRRAMLAAVDQREVMAAVMG